MWELYREIHNPLTRDYPAAYTMALELALPKDATRDDLARLFDLFAHIRAEGERCRGERQAWEAEERAKASGNQDGPKGKRRRR